MHDLHGGVGGVHALSAGSAGAADLDAQVLGFDFDIHLLGFGKNGNCGGGGVDAALRLGGGHALHAVHAALVAEAAENGCAGDTENDLTQAAQIGRTGFKLFDFEAQRIGVAAIHAVQIGCK